MKKKIFIAGIVIFLLLWFVYRDNNDPKNAIADLAKTKKIGTGRLKYAVNLFGVIPAGEAEFSDLGNIDYKGQEVRHLKAVAENLSIYHWIRKAGAVVDSYIDTKDYNPVFFSQRLILSGSADKYKEVFYDQKNGVIELDGVKRQIPYATQDPLSLTYNLRRMDWGNLKDFDLNLNTNQKNYAVKGTAQNFSLAVKGKNYDIVELNAQIFRRDKNNPYHRSQVTMYLLKDNGQYVPVLIKVFAGGILINVKLTDVW